MLIEEVVEGKFSNAAKAAAIGATTLFSQPVDAKSNLAPETSLRPVAKTDKVTVTNSPFEKELLRLAIKVGFQPVEIAAILSQAFHETMGFKAMEEMGNAEYFKQYSVDHNPSKASELGNVEPDDHLKFYGRGPFHLTGRGHYTDFANKFNVDIVNKPELVSTNPTVAAATAIYFWNKHVRPRVNDYNDVSAVTKVVNGGQRGLQKRKEYFNHYLARIQNLGDI